MTQVIAAGRWRAVLLGVALAAGVVAAVPASSARRRTLLQVDYGLSAVGRVAGARHRPAGVAAVLGGAAARGAAGQAVAAAAQRRAAHRRHRLAEVERGRRRWRAALVGVAAWQAGSLRVGLLLSGGFVATAVVLHVCGLALVWAIQPLRYARSFALRQAVLHIVRPGQPDARHPAGRRARRLLHPRRARAPGQPAARLRGAGRPRRAGHVPGRHPAGPARPGGGCRSTGRTATRRRRARSRCCVRGSWRSRAPTSRSRTTSRCAGAAACRASSP